MSLLYVYIHGLKVAHRGFTECTPLRQVPLRSSSPLRGIEFPALVRKRVPVEEAPPAPHYERAASWKVRRGRERKGKARSEGRWGPGRGKWRGGPFENARARLGPVNIMERRAHCRWDAELQRTLLREMRKSLFIKGIINKLCISYFIVEGF